MVWAAQFMHWHFTYLRQMSGWLWKYHRLLTVKEDTPDEHISKKNILSAMVNPVSQIEKVNTQHNNHVLIFMLLIAVLFVLAVTLHDTQEPEQSFLTVVDVQPVLEELPSLPIMTDIWDVDERKRLFYDFILPHIEARNAEILGLRKELQMLQAKVESGASLSEKELSFVRELSLEYEFDIGDMNTPVYYVRLLRRVDVLPPSLVIAQAAKESAWGTSRFAQEANNLFGQWCYSRGCGLVPDRRREGARHEVRAFATIDDSIYAYYLNLNTFPSYLDMRLIREGMREENRSITGLPLTAGLLRYSQQGARYVQELRALIQGNHLTTLDLEANL
jgi:Bax protein